MKQYVQITMQSGTYRKNAIIILITYNYNCINCYHSYFHCINIGCTAIMLQIYNIYIDSWVCIIPKNKTKQGKVDIIIQWIGVNVDILICLCLLILELRRI